MNPNAALRALAVILPSLVAACGGDGPAGGDASDREDLSAPDRPLAWTTEAVYSVGGFDGPDWAAFGSVQSVGFDAEGYLYILDGQTSQVTVVGPDGSYRGTLGRQGDGPGEVASATALAVTPDGRAVVPDMGKRSLVVFGRDGGWTGNVLVDLAEEGLPLRGLSAMADGRLLASEAIRMAMSAAEGEVEMRMVRPETRPVWIYPTAEGGAAVLAYEAWLPPPPPEGGQSTIRGGSSGNMVQLSMARVQAFRPPLAVAPLPDGRLALVDSVTYQVKLVAPGAGVDALLERPIPPTPVTGEIEEQERQRRLDEIVGRDGGNVRVLGGAGSFSFDGDALRRMMEDQVANMAFFPEIPAVEDLAVDSRGRIWVQRSSGVPGQDGPTDVITPDGRYLGTLPPDGLRIPLAFGPGDLAAYLETDEFDVATVRVVRVVQGEGGGA